MPELSETENKNSNNSYTIEDAMKITDKIFKLSKENNYNPGAFVHGLIFALELTQQTYKIPQQQLAQIKRGCRKYFNNIKNYKNSDDIKK
jgi:hypothetical protein